MRRRIRKDAFHDYVIHGRSEAVNPRRPWHQGGLALCARRAGRRRDRRSPATSAPTARRQANAFGEEFDQRLRPAHSRGRRVLCHAHRGQGEAFDRRTPRRPAGVRRFAVQQAVLPLRGEELARRRSRAARASREPQARPQPRVAAPVQSRRDLDARQVGVSLVRRLGPRVSHAADGARSTANSPRSSCCCSSANGTCIPTARSRPTSSPSAT